MSITLPLSSHLALQIATLPGDDAHLALEDGVVQLAEDGEYLYTLVGARGPLVWDRPEVFRADTEAGHRGRIRPGSFVGEMPVGLEVDGVRARMLLEVASRKLDYRSGYRWMVRDVTAALAEVVMRRFGVSQLRFASDSRREPGTLYARFAFLEAILATGALPAAMAQIHARPHVRWEQVTERRAAGQGVRARGATARAFARPGQRIASAHLPMLPRELEDPRTRSTVDTLPNRTVKGVLSQWRTLARDMERHMQSEPRGGVQTRGLGAASAVSARLEQMLSRGWLREVGPLRQRVWDNQVLQKRAGYREIYALSVLSAQASQVVWQGGDAVFGAGVRDVAQLYEYWCFLELARALSRWTLRPLSLDALLVSRARGLELGLRRGSESVLSGVVEVQGRRLAVALYYNRDFGAGTGSWSRSLRPDYSLAFRRLEALGEPPVWLHFDAKYRLEAVGESTTASRDDVLKMHAYRDAIHGSAGAYVLYPGREAVSYQAGGALLPGVGAFPLSPSERGAVGSDALSDFLGEVSAHLISLSGGSPR